MPKALPLAVNSGEKIEVGQPQPQKLSASPLPCGATSLQNLCHEGHLGLPAALRGDRLCGVGWGGRHGPWSRPLPLLTGETVGESGKDPLLPGLPLLGGST